MPLIDPDLWPTNLKFNRGHLLVMTNHVSKYFDLVVNMSFHYLSTDQLKDKLTCGVRAKQVLSVFYLYTLRTFLLSSLESCFFEGGHNKNDTSVYKMNKKINITLNRYKYWDFRKCIFIAKPYGQWKDFCFFFFKIWKEIIAL